MINSVEELNSQPAVILFYPSGSSGEFIAQALSESIPAFAKTTAHWENTSRVIYSDFLGRSLNSGDKIIDPNKVIARANDYLENASPGYRIILAHPHTATSKFITEYLPDIPIIEITLFNNKSRRFSKAAAENKIPAAAVVGQNINYDTRPSVSGFRTKFQLFVEWEALLLTHCEYEFDRITEFLSVTGDYDHFNQMVAEYLERNRELIEAI
jgi:hypothetical protein